MTFQDFHDSSSYCYHPIIVVSLRAYWYVLKGMNTAAENLKNALIMLVSINTVINDLPPELHHALCKYHNIIFKYYIL